ncbi:MAG TPA: VanZ family protein [Ignavibacteria bacterium]|nr:VanZ family protein [Ignavibacteria bacterium]
MVITNRFVRYHLPLISYLVFIFILSSIPGADLPEIKFELSDKIAHFLVFGLLCFLFFYSLKNQYKYVKLQKFAPEFAVLFTLLYGITDEIHQMYTPNRSSDVLDVVADFLGALVIYLIIKLYLKKTSKAD